MLDSSEQGQDVKYTVFINRQDASDDVTEVTRYVDASEDNRILHISYSSNAKQIEIVGTMIVPEFPTATAIVMAVLLAAIIAKVVVRGRM